MPSTPNLTNAQIAAALYAAQLAAITPVLAALESIQPVITAAAESLVNLPASSAPVATINYAATCVNSLISQLQQQQAQSSPLSLTVASSLPALTVGTAATAFTPAAASGGVGTVSYAIGPALPAGLTFNTATGQVTGTPTAATPATGYTVTATDQSLPQPQIAVATFSLTVAPSGS